MTEDQKIEEISIKVDDFLLNLLQEYKVAPLNISAIIAGRVLMFNETAGSVEEFKHLIEHILEVTPEQYQQTGISNEKLH